MTNKQMRNLAIRVQLFVHENTGLDISGFETADLKRVAEALSEFVALGLDTENVMRPVEEYTAQELEAAEDRTP